MPHCMVFGCSNHSGRNKEVKYFNFPKDESLKHQWILKIGTDIGDIRKFVPGKNNVLCSEHFGQESFKRDLCAELTGSRPVCKLKEDAIPTIFPLKEAKMGCPSAEKIVNLRGKRKMGMTPAEKKKFYEELNRQKKKAANAKHRAKKKAEDPPKPPKALSQTKGAIAVRKCREKKKEALTEHFVGGNGPIKEYPDPIPVKGITDGHRTSRKKQPREHANHSTFPPSKKLQPLRENTHLNTDPSEDVSKTDVTVSTVGLDSQTEGAYIVVSINQSQMSSPSYCTIRLDGMHNSFSDSYSQSETFPPAVQCLSRVPSSGEVKAEFGIKSTNYTIEEPKRRFVKSEGMEGGIEWNCAGGMMEERRQLLHIKEEEESVRMEENHECGMTTAEKYRMGNLKIKEEEEDEVEESEEKRIVKIEREEEVGENMGFRIKEEEIVDEYEENSGTDLNFPTYRCEGNLNIVGWNESYHCPLW